MCCGASCLRNRKRIRSLYLERIELACIQGAGHHLNSLGQDDGYHVASAEVNYTTGVRLVDGGNMQGIDDVALSFRIDQVNKPHRALSDDISEEQIIN